jgi:demethylmenaquinone methyltransferase/2-methoxy-6-polyprenyl-1,4-benzoquinol methylase
LYPSGSRQETMATLERLSLHEHIASKAKKQIYVNRLFETIAHRYDFFTVFMSYGMDRRWKRRLIDMAGIQGGELVLDVACGTGDITFEAATRLNAGWAIGLDITESMLKIAASKQSDRPQVTASFHRADIMRLPFGDSTFDRVTGGYALRNVPDVRDALVEIMRVLKPGGLFLSLDFGHPSNRFYRAAYLKYLSVVGSVVGYLMHGDPDTYRYIPETLKLYPGQRGVEELMKRSGFVDTGYMEFGGGIMAINYGRKPL